jgi:hypothetical protein
MQRDLVKIIGSALPHDTRIKVGVLHESDLRVKTTDFYKALAADHAGRNVSTTMRQPV